MLMQNTTLLAFFTTAALAATAARGQQVLVNEVHCAAGDAWIELHNRTTYAVDLSSWSLHHATKTPGMPQNYWWPFPSGTTLPAGGFLRVHWNQDAPPSPAANDLYTGTSVYGFLFGLGAEPLSGVRGAVGLYRTQANSLMNTASVVEDWVSYGEHGFTRETYAVQAGRWTAGRAAPSIPPTTSLARDPGAVATAATHDLQWFVDNTPTPLGPNVTGASVTSYGDACALPGHHLIGMPQLRANGLPLVGNATFGLVLDHTTGIFGEFVLVGFSAGPRVPGTPSVLPPFAGVGCQEAIDVTQFVASWLLPAQIIGTHVPLPLSGLPASAAGTELHVQALVIDLLPNVYPPYQGISNALRVVVGQ
jgi:hypothetical protein